MNDIMALIAKATWREAVTYRHTWPHEYVLMNKDQQHELVAAFHERIARGEGVECQFFHQKKQYLFLGNYKYWTEGGHNDDEIVLNRALLYRDRRDFLIRQGDSGMYEPQEDTNLEQDDDVIQLNVREMWPNEALDFTHWLAEKENLDLLGRELGLNLELVQREKAIGSLYLDILARETSSGAGVAIENQLEWTDLDHFGRLLFYASGSDSRIVIWIAPDFVFDHAQVLNQLNEWSGPNASFYGVKIEALLNEDGVTQEARFRKVVYPGGWNKELTLPQDTVPPHILKHRIFFQPLVDHLLRQDPPFADSHRQQFGYTGRFFHSRFLRDVGYAVSIEGNNSAWVTFHLGTEDKDLNKSLFDALIANRQEIEASISIPAGSDWHWYRYDSYRFSSINIRKDGSIEDSPEQLEEIRAWMLDLLPKLKETFDPRLAKLLPESED